MRPSRRAARVARGVAGAVALAALAACETSHGPEKVGAYVDDASITAKVKTRFVEEGRLDSSAIEVSTRNGVVTLSGRAADTLTRENAESITLKVPGVKLVKNEVGVRP